MSQFLPKLDSVETDFFFTLFAAFAKKQSKIFGWLNQREFNFKQRREVIDGEDANESEIILESFLHFINRLVTICHTQGEVREMFSGVP